MFETKEKENQEKWMFNFDLLFVFQDEIRQCLIDHWNIFEKRRESFPKLPKPTKSHLSRFEQIENDSMKTEKTR